ncbi:hypothetical protein [Methylobacterium sp. CM6247]
MALKQYRTRNEDKIVIFIDELDPDPNSENYVTISTNEGFPLMQTNVGEIGQRRNGEALEDVSAEKLARIEAANKVALRRSLVAPRRNDSWAALCTEEDGLKAAQLGTAPIRPLRSAAGKHSPKRAGRPARTSDPLTPRMRVVRGASEATRWQKQSNTEAVNAPQAGRSPRSASQIANGRTVECRTLSLLGSTPQSKPR